MKAPVRVAPLFVPARKIAVKRSRGKGRGIFATKALRKGELIERSPVLLVPKTEQDEIAYGFLGHYMFQTDNDRHYVIGLGLTSLINHDPHPNAEFYASFDALVIKALRTIPAGTEITIDYGWDAEEWAGLGITIPASK